MNNIDIDSLSDAELRTKLIEYGFPIMPITATTRQVMKKKLSLLIENKNRVGSTDGRRSLGRYSSEEETDDEVKAIKIQKNRRVTMAAPTSSTTIKPVGKFISNPEVGTSSPNIESRRSVTTNKSSTRTSRILKNARDAFDTGSESESDVIASELSEPMDISLKYEDTYNDLPNTRRSTPIRSSLYSPIKSSDHSFAATKNVSFASPSSRYSTSYTESSSALPGSLASNYAAEALSSIRTRTPTACYTTVSPASTRSSIDLNPNDTPFLSNFTKRLSVLSSNKKTDYDSQNDLVKEHDTNGSTMFGARSYLANFRATRGRDPIYNYKSRGNDSGKGSFVSYAVLVVAALFFIILAIVYLGMRSDTSMITSGYISPICNFHDPQNKKGINCINEDQVQNAINLLNSIRPELHKKAVAHRCVDPTIKPQMSEAEIVSFCQSNYGIKDAVMIRNDLKNLEVLLFSNPGWGVRLAQTENNDVAVTEDNLAKNMETAIFNLDKKVTSLVFLNPDVPYSCQVYNYVTKALYTILLIAGIFGILFLLRYSFKKFRTYEKKQKDEVNSIVDKILDLLQNAAQEEPGYVVINHARDAILDIKDRQAKRKFWEKAVQSIIENESRVRLEVQTVQGESFEVWRWIGSANLSMTGEEIGTKYRPGRRIVDVDYFTNKAFKFPHKNCKTPEVYIKCEIREGCFSTYILECKQCLEQHTVHSEDPESDLLDVNLAFVGGMSKIASNSGLYQMNELCSFMHIPTISGENFENSWKKIKEYPETKTAVTPKVIEKAETTILPLDYDEKMKTFLQELEKDIGVVEVLTQDQRNAELWFQERKKRLTASNFGRIIKLRDTTNREKVVNNLLFSTFKGNFATKYGQDNEPNAIKDFEQMTGKIVKKSGLIIHKDHPFLAASPDGLIVKENALVEVKCPYKAQNSTIEEAVNKGEITYVTYEDGKLTLKRQHEYYYQVQGQLHVTGKTHCYFVVWTPKGLAFEMIQSDDDCWDRMFDKLEKFYFDHMLPEILRNV
ncbi:unnamed protein product [Ceutorhynchus assimilis]|uniref:LEM domain-containing protein n=1 Tax=Ceutorhynchus assimilis TaxID=467358 RepID=A0A9N9MWM1_9CUCU|nr:unnamed protein product [Ceutorhynchus assimilis]